VGTQHYRSVGMRYLEERFLWPTEVTLSTHLSLCLRVMPNYAVVDYEGALYLTGFTVVRRITFHYALNK